MTKVSYLLAVVISLINAQFVLGQQKLVIGEKSYTIPHFAVDTITSTQTQLLVNNSLIKYKIIEPIQSSPYAFEVRCSYIPGMTINNWVMAIIKGNKDSLLTEYYLCSTSMRPLTDYSKSIKLNDNYYLNIKIKNQPLDIKTDTTISVLISHGLFKQKGMEALYAELKRKKIKLKPSTLLDCCSDYDIEVKVNNSFRSFRYNPTLLYNNPGVKQLSDGQELVSLILKTVNNATLKKD